VVVDALEKHMEVIVDDSQLSLAIGKKGQNVRLAAKLLGWKIDIKSEEEKRQEVESQMAALVAPGAPVSVLLDYGMSEAVAEKLVEGGVGTIERLGTMTPEQLEEIAGIDPASVEFIQAAVVAYYSQFEEPGTEGSSAASEAEETILSGPADEVGEPHEVGEPREAGEPHEAGDAQPEPEAEAAARDVEHAGDQSPEDPSEPASEAVEVVSGEGPETVEQFGTIEDAGSPHNHAEGARAESVPENSSGE
jgi:N utilization substance protein A